MSDPIVEYLKSNFNNELDFDFIIKKIRQRFNSNIFKFSKTQIDICILYELIIILNFILTDIDEKYNFLNIILNKQLYEVKKFLFNLINESYSYVKSKEKKEIFDIYKDETFKYDIVKIFLFDLFLNINPKKILNVNIYYRSIFDLLIFAYLNSKAKGVINDNYNLPQNVTMQKSNRHKLFENGLKLSQICCLCDTIPELKIVLDNYLNLKSKVISNEFQKLYSVLWERDLIKDNQFLILKFNNDSENRFIHIKSQTPLIFELIKSIKVKNNNKRQFSDDERILIKSSIKNVFLERLNLLMDREYSEIISETMSKNLEFSITQVGDYLNPFTLEIVYFENRNFIIEFKIFLNFIMKNLKIEELDHVV